VLKNTLLDKIVWYTNEYEQAHAKRWSDIVRKDLESFIAVLFVSTVQKQKKDKPSNWFSENRILECPVIKKNHEWAEIFLASLLTLLLDEQPTINRRRGI
jgi:hypothetical protein